MRNGFFIESGASPSGFKVFAVFHPPGVRLRFTPDSVLLMNQPPLSWVGVSSFNKGLPLAKCSTLSENISDNRCLKLGLRLEPEICGVNMTFGNLHSGCSGGIGYW